MMKTIVLEREQICRGNLVLVNAHRPLTSRHTKGLTPVDMRFPHITIQRDAANVLQLLLEKVSARNSIVPVSGYRSSEEQTVLYNASLQDNGKAFTKKYVALPGHSEHETGLAIDLGLNKTCVDFICPEFPYHGICHTFRMAAPDYGFIERYAKDKEEITGISHEPWHFRYVGYPHSKIIREKGFSLEEYIEFMKAYKADCRLIYRQSCGDTVELYYVPANNSKTSVVLPKACVYQVSGNNSDGFIITLWRKNHE